MKSKAVRGWMIITPRGYTDVSGIKQTQRECLYSFKQYASEEWCALYNRGFRCVRVKIVKEGK